MMSGAAFRSFDEMHEAMGDASAEAADISAMTLTVKQ